VSRREIFEDCTLHESPSIFTKSLTCEIPKSPRKNVSETAPKFSSAATEFASALGGGAHRVDERRSNGMALEYGHSGRGGAAR
jgi:hypothetical protein